MQNSSKTVGVFADHASAEAAIRQLAGEGIAIKDLSNVGNGIDFLRKRVTDCDHIGLKPAERCAVQSLTRA